MHVHESSHRAQPGLQAPVVGFDPVVGVLGGVVERRGKELRDDADGGVGPVGGDLDRRAIRADHPLKEGRGSLQIPLADTNTSMTCPN
jgi:hypothetical protein